MMEELMKNAVTTVSGILEWWATEAGGVRLAAALDGAAGIQITPAKVNKYIGMFKQVKKLTGSSVKNLNHIWNRSGIKEWNSTFAGHVLDHVTGVIEAYNDMSSQLNSLTPVNIDAVIDNVNSQLQVRRKNITIEDGKIEIKINLGITMSAEQIAYVMTQNKWFTVGKREAQNRPPLPAGSN